MGKPKKNKNNQKAKKMKQQWHKKGLASVKASEILLKLSAVDPQRDKMVATQETAVSSTSAEMPNREVQPEGFTKFKDAKYKKKLDREMVSKLLSSIKKKYKLQRNPRIKRRLDFRRMESPKKIPLLPLPKFYRPLKNTENATIIINETIEDGEIIEELPSSDDDDCVLLETPNVSINIDDDEDEHGDESNPSETLFNDRLAECKTTPKIFKDCQGEAALRLKTKSVNKVWYSTITKTRPTIILADSPERVPRPVPDNNDSVIIIEDSAGCIGGEDFIKIPLCSPPKGMKKSKKLAEKPERKSSRMNNSLFTSSEKKKLGHYNSNTFNPSEEEAVTSSSSKPKTNKRTIIIDGSNVAFAHGNSRLFSAEGIKYCVQYFDKMGHNVKAVIPMFRKNLYKSSNPEILDELHKEGKLVFTPCKNIPGKMSSSYDDRFILQLAHQCNAAVVSNDNYRDLIDECPAFKTIVQNRVLGYTWCDNIFLLPKDPYGRWGPTLDEILRC